MNTDGVSVQLHALRHSVGQLIVPSGKIFKHKDRSKYTGGYGRLMDKMKQIPRLCHIAYRVYHVWWGSMWWKMYGPFFPSSTFSITSRDISLETAAISDLVGDLYIAFPNFVSTPVSQSSVFTVSVRSKFKDLTGTLW